MIKKISSNNKYIPNHICLLDPSIASTNIGDDIIVDSCKEILVEIFPETQLISIPTQDVIGRISRRLLKTSKANIILGTNVFSSKLFFYRQLRWNIKDLISKYSLITMGIGWWQYQDEIDFPSRYIYRRLLNRKCLLSTRDNYSKRMLEKIGFSNIVNTSCPTMWSIPLGKEIHKNNFFNKGLLTFTDYSRDIKKDLEILKKAFSISKELFFFPQAPTDLSYLKELINLTELPLPKLINASSDSLKNFYEGGDCCYIGTRLHAGLLAARYNIPCLIIAIDNRVKEIFDDCKLDYIERKDYKFTFKLRKKFPEILLPTLDNDSINKWKLELKKYVSSKNYSIKTIKTAS